MAITQPTSRFTVMGDYGRRGWVAVKHYATLREAVERRDSLRALGLADDYIVVSYATYKMYTDLRRAVDSL